jgi:hypothetical protein
MKGNPFASLHSDNLLKIAKDVNLKFGRNSLKAKQIIGQLMADDQRDFEKFVDLNPDILLPVDLGIPDCQKLVPIDGAVVTKHLKLNEASPIGTVKTSNSPLWSEVVRRGKQRSKINKSCENEGCILEY